MVQTTIKANAAVPTKQVKCKFENRFNAEFQTIILTASASYSTEVVKESRSISTSFFEQKNVATANVYLRHRLEIEENLFIHIPASLSTNVHSGVLFRDITWDSPTSPSSSCLSIPPVCY